VTKLLTRFGFPLFLSLIAATTGCGTAGKGAKSAAEASSEGEGHAEVGKPAPDLSIHTLNGKGDISLASLSGKTVIVDFWATWCGPCKQSFPRIEELQRQLGSDTVVLAVSVDDDDSGVLDFAKETGATFAIAWDEGHTLASRWKVSTMPTTFIVDGAGIVRFIHAGYHDGETEHMAKEIAEITGTPGTRVARASKPKKTDDADARTDDAKSDASSGGTATASAAAAVPAEEEQEREPPPPPKKKSGKKAGRSGGKAAKKHTKKRA